MKSPKLRRVGVVVAVPLGCWLASACALDWHGRGRGPSGRYDAIVVLGARVQHGGTASGSLRRRAERAAELWKQGVAPHVVFTGSSTGQRPSEASVAAAVARTRGVPESAAIIEDQSTSTVENASRTRVLIGPARVLVVTDTYHVLRSELVFRRHFPESDVLGVSNGIWPQPGEALREVFALGGFLMTEG